MREGSRGNRMKGVRTGRNHVWRGFIGLAKKFVQVFPTILLKNPSELFGHPAKGKKGWRGARGDS